VDIVLSSLPKSEPYVLVAESFSGPIALRASHRRPPTAVVLCASFGKCPLPRLLIRTLRAIGSTLFSAPPPEWFTRRYLIGEAPEDVLALFNAAISAVSPHVLAHRFAVLLEFTKEYASGEMKSPLLYLQATRDRLIGPSNARFLRRLHPAARIERIESPHMILQVQPQAALDAILRGLRELME
jgi:pimeloyl-[acyl-carrier protein] methyl ester esterase